MAYADMMLDASSEADAKVMTSETTAQRLEHELQVMKHEAVQMIVRRKNIMDSKVQLVLFLIFIFMYGYNVCAQELLFFADIQHLV